MQKFSDYFTRELRTIIVVGISIRLVVFLFLQPWSPDHYNSFSFTGDKDEQEYHQLALNLLNHGEYSSNFKENISSYDHLDARRPPAYPYFLALVYFIFGVSPLKAAVLQSLLSLFISVFVYFLALKFVGKRGAMTAGIVAALEPTTLIYSFRLLPDVLFVAVLLAGLFVLISAKNWQELALAGFLTGGACWIKPAPMYLTILLTPFLFWHMRNKAPFAAFVPLFSQWLILSIWMWRNYLVYGYFAFSSIGGTNLYYYNAALTEAQQTGKSQSEVVTKWESDLKLNNPKEFDNPFFKAKHYQSNGINFIINNPGQSIGTWVGGTIGLFSHVGSSDAAQLLGLAPLKQEAHKSALLLKGEEVKNQIENKNTAESILMMLFLAFTVVLYVMSVKGVFALNRKQFSTQILIAASVYFVVITGSVGNARYRLPIIPILIVVAICGLPKKWSGDVAKF